MQAESAKSTKHGRPHLKIWQKRKKSDVISEKMSELLSRRAEFFKTLDSPVETFSRLPLSEPTLKGLKTSGFIKPTTVQTKSIKHTLEGKDIVVEAKTGSGKTLAFVIPILECIYTETITALDGPVAVILTPTRELAKQIFLVFQRVGKFHSFTMLDIMGGKTKADKRDEWQRIAKANILIGTPGRFAQQQQENPTLDMSNLRILVLDEADRLLDPTFHHDLLMITDNLNLDRQCLLFSATLSKTREQLSCLNLKSPVIISTSSANLTATPSHLIQSYSVVSLGKKLDYLWTFLQSHCKKKIIVFFSTQKQVRFVHDLFLQMRPYFAIMQLRGNMLQSKRFKIYEKFSQTPRGAVLMATNVAERGLDFPEVHWVVQFDCPKQLDDYIHRVGRTARAEKTGRAITFLLPSEVKLVELLARRNVVLRQQQFPETRIRPLVTARAPSLLASQPELAISARSAFTAYLRDYCYIPRQQQSDGGSETTSVDLRSVFQPSALPVDDLATSLGLPTTPEVPRMLAQHRLHQAPSTPAQPPSPKSTLTGEGHQSTSQWQLGGGDDDDGDDDGLLRRKTFSVLRGDELMASADAIGKKPLDWASENEDDTDDSSGEEEHRRIDGEMSIKTKKTALTRIQLAKRELKKNIRSHSKIEFDDGGNPLVKTVGGVPVEELLVNATQSHPPAKLDLDAERERLRRVVDVEDKARWRERIREKHRIERRKAKEARLADREGALAHLRNDDDEDNDDDEEEVDEQGESEGDGRENESSGSEEKENDTEDDVISLDAPAIGKRPTKRQRRD